jgi:GPH family glycoside/pentoside/hexuronide:cation symporter
MKSPEKLRLREKLDTVAEMQVQILPGEPCQPFCLSFTLMFMVFPLVSAGLLLLIARLSDGVTDSLWELLVTEPTRNEGQFRPWILWTAVPFGLILSLTFTTPPFGGAGKIVYAYISYILFTLIYTANNVPYGALMGVMTSDDKERTSLSSFRFAGAYFGGILTQGLLIYLVLFLGMLNHK